LDALFYLPWAKERPTFSMGVVGTDSISIGTWFQPAVYPFAIFVPEGTRDNEDEVDQSPDPQTSKGTKHQDGRPSLSQIKPVGAETSKEKAQQGRRQTGLRRNILGFHGSNLRHFM
jgi:hypothetical protein